METKLLQLELDMERAKRDIVIALSYTIHQIDEKITKYLDGQK